MFFVIARVFPCFLRDCLPLNEEYHATSFSHTHYQSSLSYPRHCTVKFQTIFSYMVYIIKYYNMLPSDIHFFDCIATFRSASQYIVSYCK